MYEPNYIQQSSLARILITGGGGFIGSHLVEAFLSFPMTRQVVVIDNFMTSSPRNLDETKKDSRLTVVEHDLTDLPWLEHFLTTEAKFDLILHFASPASPQWYQKEPVLTYQVNSFVTHVLAEYVTKNQARLLFASTSEVYGDPQVHPQPESYFGNVNPNGIRSCYDESKRLGETICGVWQREKQADIRIVRIFNTYGPRMDLRDGRVIPSYCWSVLENRPLTIFGDGSQTRSFCYVDDLVAGLVKMATLPNLAGETINLGNPDEFTMLELAQELEKIVGHSLARTNHPLPGDDPTRRRPDISKAKQILDWEPQVRLQEGLTKTYEYFAKLAK